MKLYISKKDIIKEAIYFFPTLTHYGDNYREGTTNTSPSRWAPMNGGGHDSSGHMAHKARPILAGEDEIR